MKIALVHDYLTQRGGAERVFELLCQYFPEADVFTSLYDPEETIELGDRPVNTTRLQNIPGATKNFRLLAPFYYPAFQALDLEKYDLIISSTTSFAKGVKKRPDAMHICFCHNVTRFLWDTETYLKEYKDFRLYSPLIEKICKKLRALDFHYAQDPDLYIANSTTVAERIRDIYGKPAQVINYPINTSKFIFDDHKEDYFYVSSRMISYKRIDIIVEAFNWLGWSLRIAGDGPERERIQAKALENIQFLGYVSDAERTKYLSKARGVIIAALEDYGLVPIEANASGTPVIAYGAGGVLDTQIPNKTGVFFKKQSPEAIYDALVEFNRQSWDYAQIRHHALSNFSQEVFFAKVSKLMEQVCGFKPNQSLNSSIQVE
ncbi:glycosyltransferase [Coleofasciculus sp. F4-SAH-05]|uniref:glycosyltransferase n=1 Tax=Coleofasciculus sp. F4-SAH-05 TaxID=3069525 RepID=UPI0032F53AC6